MLLPVPVWYCHIQSSPTPNLNKLLLDEESAQMRQLPRASDAEDSKLDQSPSDDAGVCALGLVAELGFALLHCC
jgi:hypothetical protein